MAWIGGGGFLLCFLLATKFFSVETAENERDVVFFLEESFNTRTSIAKLQDGLGRFFDLYGGRSNKFMFHVYRTSYPDNFERVVSSRDPNSLTETFGVMTANPAGPQDCMRKCCCDSLLFNYMPTLLDDHPGALMIALVDCHYDLSEQLRLELERRIAETKTTLVVFRQLDSYCTSIRGRTAITDWTFDLNSEKMGDIFAVLLLFYNSQKLSARYSQLCDNRTLSARVFSTTQAMAVVLARGQLTHPIGLYDSNNQLYTKNAVAHLDNGVGSQIIIYYADCEPNWEFANGYCFLRQRLPTTWTRADVDCRAKNATLVSTFAAQADDLYANNKLWESSILFGDATTWMSMEDFNNKKSFRWILAGFDQFIELANLNYSAWAPNQPGTSVVPGNRCVVLNRKTRQWTVSFCSSLRSYTCMKPAYYISSGSYQAGVDSYSECSFSIFSLK